MKQIIISIICLHISFLGFTQDVVKGNISEAGQDNPQTGLMGVNIYWQDSQIGTVTDEEGHFSIPYTVDYNRLIISHVGYSADTLIIEKPQIINHFLQPENQLDEVVVEQEKDALQKAFYTTQNVVTVNSAELLKAACCNLSESFETNPAIDVNFNDALTGTKQIQMLGLTSPYLLITQENIPMVRGASQTYGLTFTPGTWIESIQITKGAGSVMNGYESISGQINTELLKPSNEELLFINGYANRNGRLELNTHLNGKLSEKWSTGLFIHGNRRDNKIDNNGDGFLDAPLANQINLMNRWQFQDSDKGWISFFNVRYLRDEKQVGESDFKPEQDRLTTNAWGGEIETNRWDTSLKLGYVFPEMPYQSLGFQIAYSEHVQESYFGFNQYDIDHNSAYSNLLFNSIIGDTRNTFKTGITLAYDRYDERVNTQDFARVDRSAGAFFEYSYTNLEKISLTAGVRMDFHNRLGSFFTPRLHLRYTPWERGSFRASMGRGRRAANIFAENQQLFASSRQIQLLDSGGSIYGLDPEDAWNFGLSFLQGFDLFGRTGNIGVDFYRTDFRNQIVVDWEVPTEISFYNLDGNSTANSLQVEMNYEVLPRLELRTAYKYYDVRTDYLSGNLQKPLQARNRFFANLGYNTQVTEKGGQWRFDYTLHSLGKQRLPDTSSNPEEFRLQSFSDPYSLMNAQVTKAFSKKFEVYVGAENITGVTQPNPVLAANDPFGPYFDTSIVYAPILGSMYYAGFRFNL